MPDDLPVVELPSQAAWEQWLEQHHAGARGVWLKFAKKNTGVTTVTYAEALDVALCFGWIDGQVARLDDTHYLQRFTPRTKRSKWSTINREHVARLAKEGRMRPAGVAAVDAAKADGRWDAAYDSPSRITVPDDLREALDASPKALAAFEQLDSQNRYAILYRTHDAKRPDTRARRIAGFVEMLEQGRRPLDR